MRLKWTGRALTDLSRIRQFLSPKNSEAARRAAEKIVAAATDLLRNPRMGRPLTEFGQGGAVRERVIDDYVLRYRIEDDVIEILRLWHGREDRG